MKTAPKIRNTGLVSVIVPAFNAELSLDRCIEHILNQTYSHIELILVNDGSTDNTETIARRYKDHLIYIAQENRGETAARNRGFEAAKGEFITFIDHDDYWEPEFIELTVSFLQTHPDAIAVNVGSQHRSVLSKRSITRPSFLGNNSSAGKPIILEQFFNFWFVHDHICAGSAMIRGSLFDTAGGQRTDLVLSGDLEYWAYLATFGKWGFIPRVLLHVDGTQVPNGNIYRKYYDRYARCSSVEDWEMRILPRLRPEDQLGFARIRGRVATWYTFAKIFIGKDADAMNCAAAYKKDLDGIFGRLWRLGLIARWLTWKPLCIAMRARTRLHYRRANIQHSRTKTG